MINDMSDKTKGFEQSDEAVFPLDVSDEALEAARAAHHQLRVRPCHFPMHLPSVFLSSAAAMANPTTQTFAETI
jgi:hypothetical protein